MTTRNRRKREQKPSKRWREFMCVPVVAERAWVDACRAWWMTANNNGPPGFAGGGVWSADDTQRHAL